MRVKILLASLIVCLSSGSQAELHDRDGGMIYDDVLDITWLQDANYAMTSGFDSNGLMNWNDSVAWSENLIYGGFDDWRLPSMDINGDTTVIQCNVASELVCRDNELGYMYYQNLMGTISQSLIGDQGLIVNIQGTHWSSTLDTLNVGRRWAFTFNNGYQDPSGTGNASYAPWAVRDGDAGIDDADGDGIGPETDNCTWIANPDQRDTDNDGHGNVCDFDFNNDCVTNFFDLFQISSAFLSRTGDPNFNEHVDNNADGFINFGDFGAPPNSFGAFFSNPPGPSATVCGEAPW